jgi:hypothetical protein
MLNVEPLPSGRNQTAIGLWKDILSVAKFQLYTLMHDGILGPQIVRTPEAVHILA